MAEEADSETHVSASEGLGSAKGKIMRELAADRFAEVPRQNPLPEPTAKLIESYHQPDPRGAGRKGGSESSRFCTAYLWRHRKCSGNFPAPELFGPRQPRSRILDRGKPCCCELRRHGRPSSIFPTPSFLNSRSFQIT